ncbi:hypothetical protein H9V85_004510 [Salmonella enterica subsp. enterica serovar Louisiana]|nr:hypothetical protein [Salmonella enterica subsp. enterica serovar Louisiana]ECQ6399653.1 hypothetical protein [Salmonella enterica subsp. enterica serovar Onireke]ECY3521691.1 hypothetical protein [Salmonella enterica subsp. enterica serovar Ridge]EDS6807292.1 hypothetical protein [Salmonella enterica subsp. enterica serovar Legon]EDV9110226.1 hypothetical protein [Salmonella enterica subsp. enterica]EEF6843603.1 hypothetical protein [Salmonella enterica]
MECFICLNILSVRRMENGQWQTAFKCASPVGEDDTIESIADYFFDEVCGDFIYDPESGEGEFKAICEPINIGTYTLPLYPWHLNEDYACREGFFPAILYPLTRCLRQQPMSR